MNGERSFTDPLVNVLHLGPFDSTEAVTYILNKKTLPAGSLPLFLHEATHHWCFNSPLGRALTLQYCLLSREGAQISNEDPELFDGEIAKYNMVLGVTKPLAEGLALFAEHDVWPGYTDTISAPQVWAALLYRTTFEDMKATLAATRLSPDHIKSKASLLMTGFADPDGIYLAGYLATKCLWQRFRGTNPRFGDGEFFLQYLRYFFYDDWGAVNAAILGSYDDFPMHFFRRFDKLLSKENITTSAPGVEERLRKSAFELFVIRNVLKKISLAVAYIPILPSEDTNKGQKCFAGLARRVLGQSTSKAKRKELTDQELTLRLADLSTYLSHDVMTIGRATFPAKVAGTQLEIRHPDGELLYAEPVLSTILGGWSGDADVSVLASARDPLRLAALVLIADQVVSAKILMETAAHEFSEPKRAGQEFRDYFKIFEDKEIRLHFAKIRRELVKNASLDRPSAGIDTKRLVMELFRPATFLFLPVEDTERTYQAMNSNGVLSLLEDNLPLLDDAAAASLAAPFRLTLPTLDHIHSWSEGSAKRSIDVINRRLGGWFGVEPFLLIEDRLVSSII